MMKNIFILFCFITLLLCCSFASTVEGMTPAQEREYLSKALSIQESLSTKGTTSIFNINKYASYGVSNSSTNTEWVPYQGASPISKIDFFRITGEQELLKEALAIEKRSQDRKKLGWGLTIGGAIGYAAGLGVMFSSLNDPDNLEKPLLTGAAISLLFAIPFGIGIDKLLYVEKQDVSASFAAGIADIYNRELEAKIKVSF